MPTLRPSPQLSTPPELVNVDTVALSDSGRRLSVHFFGAPKYDEANPCSADYIAATTVNGDELELSVSARRPMSASDSSQESCPDIAFPRQLDVDLPQPFTGFLVHDLGGEFHVARQPDRLVNIDVPPGWQLVGQNELPTASVAQWCRVYMKPDIGASPTTQHELQLCQAFGGPSPTEGVTELPSVEIDGQQARVWSSDETGEIVVSWMLGSDGLVLVANESQFTETDLLTLASTAVPS